MSPDETANFKDLYKTAIRTTRDAVIKPRPRFIPRPLWRWFARQVINFDQIPIGTITEVTLSDGSVQAQITLAGQRKDIHATETPKN